MAIPTIEKDALVRELYLKLEVYGRINHEKRQSVQDWIFDQSRRPDPATWQLFNDVSRLMEAIGDRWVSETARWAHKEKISDMKKWVCANIRKGSVVMIGANYRKVVEVSRPEATLTLVKIKPSGYPGNTTVCTFYDYWKKMKGIPV